MRWISPMVRRLGQRERQQQRRLLRAEVVGRHHAGLVPVVAAHDAALADARAHRHHGAPLLDDVGNLLVETVGCAGADARNHNPLAPSPTSALATPARVPVWM